MNKEDSYALCSILYGLLALYCVATRNILFVVIFGIMEFWFLGLFHGTLIKRKNDKEIFKI